MFPLDVNGDGIGFVFILVVELLVIEALIRSGVLIPPVNAFVFVIFKSLVGILLLLLVARDGGFDVFVFPNDDITFVFDDVVVDDVVVVEVDEIVVLFDTGTVAIPATIEATVGFVVSLLLATIVFEVTVEIAALILPLAPLFHTLGGGNCSTGGTTTGIGGFLSVVIVGLALVVLVAIGGTTAPITAIVLAFVIVGVVVLVGVAVFKGLPTVAVVVELVVEDEVVIVLLTVFFNLPAVKVINNIKNNNNII